MLGRTEKYQIYERGRAIGVFTVDFTIDGRFYSVNIDEDFDSDSFVLLPKHIGHKHVRDWISDRIIPKTRIGIETNLKAMGLSEYDELAILQFTSARSTTDSCWIDFSKKL